jgi:hypothetical protein
MARRCHWPDQPPHIRITDLAPSDQVTVATEARDGGGRQRRAEATFTADGQGIVDLDRARPTGGSRQRGEVKPAALDGDRLAVQHQVAQLPRGGHHGREPVRQISSPPRTAAPQPR